MRPAAEVTAMALVAVVALVTIHYQIIPGAVDGVRGALPSARVAVEAAGAHGCLHGASLELRLDDAWRRWAVDGRPMRNCDAEALQEASELVRRCGAR